MGSLGCKLGGNFYKKWMDMMRESESHCVCACFFLSEFRGINGERERESDGGLDLSFFIYLF